MTYEIQLDGHPTERIEADHREKAWDEYKRRHLRPVVNGEVQAIHLTTRPIITEVT